MRKKRTKRLRPAKFSHTLQKKKRNRSLNLYRMWKNWRSRTLLLAGIFALVIGTFFGMLTLSIFNEEEMTHTVSQSNDQAVSTTNDDDNSEMIEVEPLTFYVIQAGMFKEEQNAKEEQKRLQKKKLETFIWPQEENYFVLLSIHDSEEQAKKHLEEISDEEFFFKKWDTVQASIPIAQDVNQWIDRYRDTFIASLEAYEKDGSYDLLAWEELAQENNLDNSTIEEVQTEMTQLLERVDEKKETDDNVLLQLAYLYEQLSLLLK